MFMCESLVWDEVAKLVVRLVTSQEANRLNLLRVKKIFYVYYVHYVESKVC